MSSLNTKKIRQNADLVNPMSGCPFGKPVAGCPFIPYFQLKDERKQVEQLEYLPQDLLNEMRSCHRQCMKQRMKKEIPNYLK